MADHLFASEELIHSTVRITTRLPAGMQGSGTGFFFQFCERDGEHIPAIVTNKHVLDGAIEVTIHLSMKDTEGRRVAGPPQEIRITAPQGSRIDHPDPSVDLAIIPCGALITALRGRGLDPHYRAFGPSHLPTAEEMNDLGALEPIVMVGYPIGLWDDVNNSPILRRGVTATHPCFAFQGRPEFVIDCSCWPGSSGSPVILFNDSGFVTRSGGINLGATRVRLLGVLYGGPAFDAEGRIVTLPIPTSAAPITLTSVMVNLGFVITAARLLEIERILEQGRRDHTHDTP